MRKKQPLLKRRIVVIPLAAVASMLAAMILSAIARHIMTSCGAPQGAIMFAAIAISLACGFPGGIFSLSILYDSRYDSSFYE